MIREKKGLNDPWGHFCPDFLSLSDKIGGRRTEFQTGATMVHDDRSINLSLTFKLKLQ